MTDSSTGAGSGHEDSASRRLWGAAGALAIAALVVVVLLILGVFDSGGGGVTAINAPASARATQEAEEGLRTPGEARVGGQAPFTLHYPSGWSRLSAAQLARIPHPPAAGLVAAGGKALLLVRPKEPLTQSVRELSEQLTRSLSARFPDFRLLGSGTTRTLAGPAWVYTFERTKAGLVQTEAVISTSNAAYEIDIALHAGANRAAGQIGEIIHSFQT